MKPLTSLLLLWVNPAASTEAFRVNHQNADIQGADWPVLKSLAPTPPPLTIYGSYTARFYSKQLAVSLLCLL